MGANHLGGSRELISIIEERGVSKVGAEKREREKPNHAGASTQGSGPRFPEM